MKTSVSAPWWFLYHTHYIVSGIFCLFIIVDYDIFSSLRPTISYPRTMSAYNFFLFVSSPYVPTLDLITYLFDPTLTTFPIFLLFNLIQTLLLDSFSIGFLCILIQKLLFSILTHNPKKRCRKCVDPSTKIPKWLKLQPLQKTGHRKIIISRVF